MPLRSELQTYSAAPVCVTVGPQSLLIHELLWVWDIAMCCTWKDQEILKGNFYFNRCTFLVTQDLWATKKLTDWQGKERSSRGTEQWLLPSQTVPCTELCMEDTV